ncbi:MAG: LysM peptidoglycan-binding domain-containing protein [Pseudomonadales bacterium]
MATWRRVSAPTLGLMLTLTLVLGGCQLSGTSSPGASPTGESAAETTRVASDANADDPSTKKPAASDALGDQDEDLWDAIRIGFELDHEPDHPRVRHEIAAFCRYPSYLASMSRRLQLFMPHVFAAVQTRGLPAEIALLPIVESGMNPEAEALRGPTGMWQIIPATGDRLGLPRNPWFDGRRDPVLSTRAALDYLESGHARLKDWRLAIVAYNTGEGAVIRALSARGGNPDFWSLSLPYHGKQFVPRLLALAALIDHPEQCGFKLPALKTRQPFETIDTGGIVSVPETARALNLAEEDLYVLNPGLNRDLTPPDGPHQLHVPREFGSAARTWIADLTNRPVAALPASQRVTIRPGDSLSAIARRQGTDVATLRELNGLRGDFLRAGATLLVPETRAQVRSRSNRQSEPPLSASTTDAARASSARSPRTETHVVRAGDTLWRLAREYRVSLNRLLATNNLTPGSVLRIGQRLRIPSG